MPTSFVIREIILSQACAGVPLFLSLKISRNWQQVDSETVNSGVAAQLTSASGEKLKSVQTREWGGGHGWSLTWGGTPASGRDVRAALGMQNLSSGICSRSLTTSVKEGEEQNKEVFPLGFLLSAAVLLCVCPRTKFT